MKRNNFIPLAGSAQSAEIDRLAEKKYGLSAEILMESAGALSAKEILERHKENQLSSVMILCGPGHNGGDGLVVARHLISEGINVEVFCPDMKSSTLVEKQKDKLRALNKALNSLEKVQKVKKRGENCSVIVDALFGVGLIRNIEGFYVELIQWMNSSGKSIIALDTPSGLDVNTGQVKGSAVKANLTLTFGLSKPGFYLMQGPSYVGRLKIFSIGFPAPLLSGKADTHFLIEKSWVASRLPKRQASDHKACQGHLLVLAGREGFLGAGVLASLSAYRMGVGYVTWVPFLGSEITHSSISVLIKDIPDVLTQELSDSELFKNKTAVAVGPGLGTTEETKEVLLTLKKTKLPVVVDADAFTVCVKENLFPLPAHWVLTPHSGELARLFDITGKEVDQNRCAYAMKASQKTGCQVLLKGFYSVLAQKDKCWIIPKGNSALAKAGTGDVLTGFIGALMARSLDAFSATALAAFVHGSLAEEWVESGKDKDSLMAQDLKDILPVVLQKLRQGEYCKLDG
jgi:NAD(P)H-hydrate epimerase